MATLTTFSFPPLNLPYHLPFSAPLLLRPPPHPRLLSSHHTSDCGPISRSPSGSHFNNASPQSSSVHELKISLFKALEGLNRGIFGVPLSRRNEIHKLIRLMEDRNPLLCPTANLEKLAGDWRLLYSTISILGSKRTKLGLRDFVTLGDFIQTVDVEQSKAVNKIKFSVAALSLLRGALTVEASYSVANSTRVDIRFEKSSIAPQQLLNAFRGNYNLLVNTFNPEGWLEITYVDDSIRIGRDNKGNIYVLEKVDKVNS